MNNMNLPDKYEQWLRVFQRGFGRDRSKNKKGATHRGGIYEQRDNGSYARLTENPAGTKLARKAAAGRCGF